MFPPLGICLKLAKTLKAYWKKTVEEIIDTGMHLSGQEHR